MFQGSPLDLHPHYDHHVHNLCLVVMKWRDMVTIGVQSSLEHALIDLQTKTLLEKS